MRNNMDELKKTKEAEDQARLQSQLKKFDEVELPMDDLFFDRMHDQIMAKVEQTEIEKVSPGALKFQKWRKKVRYAVQRTGAMTMMIAAGFLIFSQAYRLESKWQEAHANFKTEEAVKVALTEQEEFNKTLISYQNENEFYLDVANRSFDDLNLKKLNELLGSTERVSR